MRILIQGLLVLLILLAGILIAGQIARGNLAKKFPPPGKLVKTQDGHLLHVRCEGQGPVTILLEAGLNNFSVHWSRLQPLLAQEARTCAYDRAGLGWSELSPNPPTIENMAKDLHTVVQSLGGGQPLILVGHSFGSLLVRMYAQQHPQNIKAIVLLDPANEYMGERIPGYSEALAAAATQFRNLIPLASAGLVAFSTGSIPTDQLQGEALEQYRAALASGNFFKGAAAETAGMIHNLKSMQSFPHTAISNIPVVIISRGQSEPIPGLPENSAQTLDQTWAALQADLVSRLGAKQIIAEKSGHNIQLSQPELVHETIRPFVVRSHDSDEI